MCVFTVCSLQQVLEQDKRDSGTCDHLEAERDGVIVVDVACNTVVTGEVNGLCFPTVNCMHTGSSFS